MHFRDIRLGGVQGWRQRHQLENHFKELRVGFPGGTVVKNLPANAGDTGSIPGPGGSHMPRSS